jgi:hypothetical protein
MTFNERQQVFEAARDRFLAAVAAMTAAVGANEKSENVLMPLMDEVTESQNALIAATDALRSQ